jgi:hypothetical protein
MLIIRFAHLLVFIHFLSFFQEYNPHPTCHRVQPMRLGEASTGEASFDRMHMFRDHLLCQQSFHETTESTLLSTNKCMTCYILICGR